MKTIFNEDALKKILAIILVAIVIIVFILVTIRVRKSSQSQIPISFINNRSVSSNPSVSNQLNLHGDFNIDLTADGRGLGYAGQRKAAMDKKGDIYAAYRKKYGGQYEIFVSKISRETDSSVSVSNVLVANIQAGSQRVPSIAVDSKGTVHVVWYGSDTVGQENNRQIKYSRSEDQGKTWSSWRNISFVSGYMPKEIQWQEHPSLLVGKDDTLYVVWEGKDEQNGNQQIKFSKSENGGNTWSPWKNVEAAASNTQSRPSLIEGQDGSLYLFAYSSEGNGFGDMQQVQYAVSSDKGDTWSPWQVISDPLTDSRHISAIIDSKGTIHAVWRSGQSGPTQIIYRAFENGQWGDIIPIAASSKYQFFPTLGLTSNGVVYAAWMESANASGFPREDPAAGESFISFMKSGTFQSPLSLGANTLYPNVPEVWDYVSPVPVLYLKQSGMSYSVKMRFFDVPK